MIDRICLKYNWTNLWTKRSAVSDMFNNMINSLMRESKGFRVNLSHPHLCPIKGRLVVDVSTGEVFERTMEHGFSSEYNVRDVRTGEANEFVKRPTVSESVRLFPNVTKFMLCVFGNDFSQVLSFQMLLAYCAITGWTHEKYFFVWFGLFANNAKSTLVRWVLKMMGDVFGSAIDKKAIIEVPNRSGCTNERMPLEHARLSFSGEIGEHDKMDDSFMKSLRGRDRLFFKGMYQSGRNVEINGKLTIPTNYPLNIKSSDSAMTGSEIIVPFEAQFLNEPEMKDAKESPDVRELLSRRTHANACYIFKRDEGFVSSCIEDGCDELFWWLVAGCIRYCAQYNRVLQIHPTWQEEKKVVREDQDYTSHFITESLEVRRGDRLLEKKARSFVQTEELVGEYDKWFTRNHPHQKSMALSKAQFLRAMATRFKNEIESGEVERGKRNNKTGWFGLAYTRDNDPTTFTYVSGGAHPPTFGR